MIRYRKRNIIPVFAVNIYRELIALERVHKLEVSGRRFLFNGFGYLQFKRGRFIDAVTWQKRYPVATVRDHLQYFEARNV